MPNAYSRAAKAHTHDNEGIRLQKLLAQAGFGSRRKCEEIITDFFITGCPKVKPMQLLVSIMDAQTGQGGDHKLKRIRAVGFDETYDDVLEGCQGLLSETIAYYDHKC